jgi:mannose-6-phosphate isomerase-like protein (cupin superfamily)
LDERAKIRRVKPQVSRPDEAAEFATPELCRILESWNVEVDPAVSIARARVAPGVTTKLHRLAGVIERYVIVEGEGRVAIGAEIRERVGPGDIAIVPAGVTQQITNTGSGDLVFYCVCTPRFTQECYEALE